MQHESKQHHLNWALAADVVIFDLETGALALGDVISDPANDFASGDSSDAGSLAPVITYTFLQPPKPGSVTGVTHPAPSDTAYVETLMRLQYYAIILAYGDFLLTLGSGMGDCFPGCAHLMAHIAQEHYNQHITGKQDHSHAGHMG